MLLQAVALLTLLTIIAINLALGILPHVDNFAHIGGFLTGFLLGFILLIRPQFGWSARHNLPPGSEAKSKYMAYQCVLWILALILFIAGYVFFNNSLFFSFSVNIICIQSYIIRFTGIVLLLSTVRFLYSHCTFTHLISHGINFLFLRKWRTHCDRSMPFVL